MTHSHPSTTPASYSQRSMWAFALRYRTAHLNEMVIAWRVQGPLDAAVMAAALGDIVTRHATLRARLSYQHGQLHQVVMPVVPGQPAAALPTVEVPGSSAEQRLAAALEALEDPERAPLDIINGPTLLARLFKLGHEEHLLGLCVHHAMCDGWSIGLMLRELLACYQARVHGRPAELPALTEQYADVVARELNACATGQFADEIRHWKTELADLPPPLALPAVAPRKGQRDWRASVARISQPAAFIQRLREQAGRLRASPFALQLAALAVVLHQRSGSEDMLIGVPTLNRWSAAEMQIVGYLTSLLPVRVRPGAALGFDALCAQAHTAVRKMLANGRVPLEVLLRETPLTPTGNTVFPVWAQFVEDAAAGQFEAAGLRFAPVALARRNLLAELDVDLLATAREWHCEFGYRAALFQPEAMGSMLSDLLGTLCQVMEQPRMTVGELAARLS